MLYFADRVFLKGFHVVFDISSRLSSSILPIALGPILVICDALMNENDDDDDDDMWIQRRHKNRNICAFTHSGGMLSGEASNRQKEIQTQG